MVELRVQGLINTVRIVESQVQGLINTVRMGRVSSISGRTTGTRANQHC